MADALGFMLPAAVAALALSLPEVVVVILLLDPGKSRANANGFAGGLVISYLAVSAAVLLLANALELNVSDERSNWVAVLLLLVGLALVYVGIRQVIGRPGDRDQNEQTSLSRAVANLTPVKAISLGAVMGGFNPAFLALIGSLTAELTLTNATRTEKAVVMLVFVLIGSAGVLGPLVAVQFARERAQAGLTKLHEFLNTRMWLIMTVIFIYFGIKLIGDALRALT